MITPPLTVEDLTALWLQRAEAALLALDTFPSPPALELPALDAHRWALWDALAAHAGLQRLRRDPDGEVLRIKALLGEALDAAGAGLSDHVLALPLRATWEEAWACRERDRDDPALDEADHVRQARELLELLDDLDLAACALRCRFGAQAAPLEELAAAATHQALAHAELLVAAAAFIDATCAALRSDLADDDLALAASTFKLQALQIEAEAAARPFPVEVDAPTPALTGALGRTALAPPAPDAGRRALAPPSRRPPQRARPALPRRDGHLMHAHTGDDEGTLLRWAPLASKGWSAFLRLPAPARASEDAALTLYVSGAPPGVMARLCGVERTLEASPSGARARYTLGALREAWAREDVETLVLIDLDGLVWPCVLEEAP